MKLLARLKSWPALLVFVVSVVVTAALGNNWVRTSPVRVARQDLERGWVQPAYAVIRQYRASNSHDREAMVIMAHCLESMGRLEQADQLFQKAAPLSKKDSFRHCQIRQNVDTAHRAASAWAEHLKQFPEDEEALLIFVGVLARAKKFNMAMITIKKLVELNPNNPNAWSVRGLMESREGFSSMAKQSFQKAFALDPKLETIRLEGGIMHLYYGESLVLAGEAKLGEEHVRKAIEQQTPNLEMAYYLLGSAREGQGDVDGAAQWWERCLTVDENYFPALAQLGRYYVRVGDAERAGLYLHRAEQIDDTDTEILYSLASLYRRLRENDKADAYLKRFNEINAQREQMRAERQQ